MRFSSIAVSLLAQSVPLLAVGHLAGWKKREERSWLQRRRLRDALLMGVHDKKGMLFEKHVRVNGKHVDVLEKKRSGSARLVQVDVSSKASVECDPLSKVTDSGIFGCGMDSHCVESKESKLGGLCVSSKQSPSINRALQGNGTCVETDLSGYTCDCSEFDNTNSVGKITCSGPGCLETACFNYTYSALKDADGSFAFEKCWELNETVMGLESYCKSVFGPSSDPNSWECEIKANGVVCNSCDYWQSTCPARPNWKTSPFNCTNTVFNSTGDTCLPHTGPFGDLLASVSSETGAPSATPLPTTACAETDFRGFTCDCSEFDNTNSVGNITCSGPHCRGTAKWPCFNYSYSTSSYADGSFSWEWCGELNETIMGLENYCYSIVGLSSDPNSWECECKANGVVCNSCEYFQSTCPSHPNKKVSSFDCTNTVFNSTGDMCANGGPFGDLVASVSSETDAPNATSMPRTETSSARSHAANIVVSAAAAAWMASIGT